MRYKKSVLVVQKNTQRAFTIAELIVVIGIFTLIMSVALWNQKDLNNSVLVTNLAYEIALAVREAQAYGIGVRAIGAGANTDFRGAFGIHVNKNNPNQIILFNDKNNDNFYDINETFIVYNFQNQRGNKIKEICVAHALSSGPCMAGIASTRDEVNILFKRPNPEAFFSAKKGATPSATIGPVIIVINTPANNNCRAIVVETTGQIHIEKAQGSFQACANAN